MLPSDKPGRIPCQVLGCRRTARASDFPPHTIIVCGKCWRMAAKPLRRRIRKIERIGRKIGIDWDTVDWEVAARGPLEKRILTLHSELFRRIIKSATNMKVGIGG